MTMQKILIIDDDPDTCTLLSRFLTRKGYLTVSANSGRTGIAAVEAECPDLIVCDFRLGDMDGNEMLPKLRERWAHIPVLVITGYSDIRMAVHVMKLGAFDYISKPIVPDEILLTIQRALESPSPAQAMAVPEAVPQPATAKPRPSQKAASGHIMGNSLQAQTLYKQIGLVAPTNYGVIIYGESGSGKESIARMIHDSSLRAKQPFVPMDCGAISKDLANSELFGHEKGAFTGALALKIGHFELANGGTLFLDEVSNLPYDAQVALLRVLQERRLKRIGSTKEIPLDVRIIVASNERLLLAARQGKFREDLYHRFNEFSLEVPPLRERREDILLFAERFLADTARELGKSISGFTDDVAQIFLHYPWYGNVRELKNVIKRATLLTDGAWVEAKSLPFEIAHFSKLDLSDDVPEITAPPRSAPSPLAPPAPPIVAAAPQPNPIPPKTDLKTAAGIAEYEAIVRVLQEAHYNKSKAAELLGIDRKTLYNKLKTYNIG